jgi:hypothetical protein
MPRRSVVLCALAATAALALTAGFSAAFVRPPDHYARPLPQRFVPEPAGDRGEARAHFTRPVLDAIEALRASTRELAEAVRSMTAQSLDPEPPQSPHPHPSLLPVDPPLFAAASAAAPQASAAQTPRRDTPDETTLQGCTTERRADGAALTTVVRCTHQRVVSAGNGSASVTSFGSTSASSVSTSSSR